MFFSYRASIEDDVIYQADLLLRDSVAHIFILTTYCYAGRIYINKNINKSSCKEEEL